MELSSGKIERVLEGLAEVAEWYTRTVQNRIPQGLEVRVLSSALLRQSRISASTFFAEVGKLVDPLP